MATYVNGTHTNGTAEGSSPKITLYTNHACPWAQRAHVTLKELNLPYEQVIIPLDRPREQWYLDINPRGLVPSLKINSTIITESLIVSQYLADTFPKPAFLPPSSSTPTAGLFRARANFFIDTWFSKLNTYFYPLMKADEGEEKEKIGKELVAAIEKEIEPLLEGVGPFFGGSKEMTFADAMVAPFLIRQQQFSERYPALSTPTIAKSLSRLSNYSKWSAAVLAQESVNYTYDGDAIAKSTIERIKKLKESSK